VPELAPLPASLIDQPWTATSIELKAAGMQLGETRPRPIIDHKKGRDHAEGLCSGPCKMSAGRPPALQVGKTGYRCGRQ
jgi:hypothetical protein